jgi:choline dehydrogenase-like flavoprotein
VSGSIDLTYGSAWMANVGDVFVAATQAGLPLNEDVNSGNPIGMGMSTVSITPDGQRLTAASAYLRHVPTNLVIAGDTLIRRVIFKDKRAVGVQTVSGKTYKAKCEIILSGGAINTPQLLLLSGVGPSDELSRHGIEQVQDLPMVGQNLQDHCFSAMGIVLDRKADTNVVSQSPSPMGWFKLMSVDETQECVELTEQVRTHRLRATVPDFEIATVRDHHTPRRCLLLYSLPRSIHLHRSLDTSLIPIPSFLVPSV